MVTEEQNQHQQTGGIWVLVATILASGIVFLDSSVVNVALPAIDRQLNTGLSGLQWIVDGYVLTLAAFLILGGSLGDRYGRRKMMMFGLAGFAAASIASGLAPTLTFLIAARLLQGCAGALLVPGSLALLRSNYSDPEQRGQAIGQWSGWSGITTVIGPLLGGWLVDSFSWRWIFFINVPIVLIALWMLYRHVGESRDEQAAQRLDWTGGILAIMGLGGLAYGLIEGPVLGWSSAPVLFALGGGILILAIFPFVESRREAPMVPLDLFQVRNFTGANLVTLGVYFALSGTTFFLVIYLQNVGGYSALNAGLALAPISLIMLLLSPQIGKLAGKVGARWFMTGGPLVLAGGLLLLTRLDPQASYTSEVLPAVLVFGFGLASTVAPLTNTVISAVPDRRSGVAAAINNVASRVAGLLAVAGLGVVVSLTFNASLAQRTSSMNLSQPAQQTLNKIAQDPTGSTASAALPTQAQEAVNQAYTAAFRRALQVCAALAFVGGGVAALTIRNEPVESDTSSAKRAKSPGTS
jgi:EmrB/QacA subfamily drug resistance transporter